MTVYKTKDITLWAAALVFECLDLCHFPADYDIPSHLAIDAAIEILSMPEFRLNNQLALLDVSTDAMGGMSIEYYKESSRHWTRIYNDGSFVDIITRTIE